MSVARRPGVALIKASVRAYCRRERNGYTGWTFKANDDLFVPTEGLGLTSITSGRFADGASAFLRKGHDRPFLLHVSVAVPPDARLMPRGRPAALWWTAERVARTVGGFIIFVNGAVD